MTVWKKEPVITAFPSVMCDWKRMGDVTSLVTLAAVLVVDCDVPTSVIA